MGFLDFLGPIGAIAGAIIGGNASEDAANAQRDAAAQTNATQLQIFNQIREDQAPYRRAGAEALDHLTLGTLANQGEFRRRMSPQEFLTGLDPGYQFRMDEGMKALQRSASARGGLLGGGTLKALTRYSQGVASQEYENAFNRFETAQGNRFNRIASIAGLGQTANQQAAQAGINYGNQVGENNAATGNAIAAGAIGRANSINQGIQTGLNYFQNYSLMNRLFGRG